MDQNTLLGILIPFAGTALGSAMVFFMKKEMDRRLEKMLLGFASGVMMAASVWSLLIPAIDMAEQEGGAAWFPPAVGFLMGMGFLLVLDTLTPHLHYTEEKPEGVPAHLKKTTMLVLAVTLHNIPEGMAVGVTFAGVLADNAMMTLAGAFALSIGIAIQNFPEGAIISMPLKSQGLSKKRSFLYGGPVRDRGADRRAYYDPADRACRAAAPVSAVIRGRGDDLCRGRRTDPGSTDRRAFQYQHRGGGSGVCDHDGAGCCLRIGHLDHIGGFLRASDWKVPAGKCRFRKGASLFSDV